MLETQLKEVEAKIQAACDSAGRKGRSYIDRRK